MIDLSSERVVSLAHATKHLPERRGGKRPNVATIYQWAQVGVRGVRLEVVQVGGTKCTSLEALQRFCERLSDPPPPRRPARRKPGRRPSQAAEKRLAAAGI